MRLLHDGVVAVREQMLLDGFGLVFVGEGAHLDVEELIPVAGPDGRIEAAFPQRTREHFGVFLPADGGNLNDDGMARNDLSVAGGLGERR